MSYISSFVDSTASANHYPFRMRAASHPLEPSDHPDRPNRKLKTKNQKSALLFFPLLLAFYGVGASMELGGNLWNLGWHRPDDCFRNVREVTGADPWNPQFLREVSIYRSLRFMDWDRTNGSERERWSQRPHKDNPRQNPVAYEWMIDLCNRTGADLWVTVPHRTISHNLGDQPGDYGIRLAILVKTGIDLREVELGPLLEKLHTMTAADLVAAGGIKTCEPLKENLKLYLEYSNETWNGGFKQTQYCSDEGVLVGLDANRSTAAYRYHAWAAIRLFRAGELVFGPGSLRLVKVLATQSANPSIAPQHLQVMQDPKWNPWGIKASAIATAPYFGHKVDGKALDATKQLRESIKKAAADSAKHREIADRAGLKLIAYEGGQHITTNAKLINRDPAMFALYQEYLREMSQHFTHFCHYAHVGMAGENGAWGAIEFTGQPLNDAHKYRALKEWSGRKE